MGDKLIGACMHVHVIVNVHVNVIVLHVQVIVNVHVNVR